MTPDEIRPGIHLLSLGPVNAYLVEGDSLTLVDTGVPGSAPKILNAIETLGYSRSDLAQIIVTYLHADHGGSLAALKKATGAVARMHPLDGAMVARCQSSRPVQPAPGLIPWLIATLFLSRGATPEIEPAEIEQELAEGDRLAAAQGAEVVHTPGHAAGQVALLVPADGGVLLAADAASNIFRLGYPPIFEEEQAGIASLIKLATREFDVALFGHGGPLQGRASEKFRSKWGRTS